MSNEFELSKFEVEELDNATSESTNGGVFPLWPFIGGLAVALVADWDNFKAGLAGKPEIKD